MNSKMQYQPVNWKNGMSFSEDHLIQQDLATLDAVKDATAVQLTPYNWGLLGGAYLRRSSESFIDNITLEKIQVHTCRAVTQNGSRIEILDEDLPELTASLTDLTANFELSKSKYWYLLLVVKPFSRLATGEVMEDESPRRQPFTRATFALELLSEADIALDNLANVQPIARFEYTASGIRKDDDYIPPCCAIDSSDALVSKYEFFDQYVHLIKEHAEKIREKVALKRRQSRENNRLAEDLDQLCKSFILHFVHHYDEYRLVLKSAAPIRLVHFFARQARVLDYSLDQSYDRTHVLKYLNQYATNLSVPQIGELFTAVYTQAYHHYDCLRSITAIERLLINLEAIFKTLRGLDYRELAPRGVVTGDHYLDAQQPTTRDTRSSLKIKNPGRSEHLGDDLRD